MKLLLLPTFLLCQTCIILGTCEKNSTLSVNNFTLSGSYLLDIVDKVNEKDSNVTVSLQCGLQLYALSNNSDILLKMADAWSKFPYTGLMKASRNDYGNYDECIALEVDNTASGKILGKHCTYGLVIPDFTLRNETRRMEKAWKLSYCIPDACTAQDLINVTGLSYFNDAMCSTKETNITLDIGAVITLSIFIVIILLMVISTIHDTFLYYNERENTNIISNSFSIFNNGKKLFTVAKHSKENFLFFQGIKFVSLWWIMAGRGATAWQNLPVMNRSWQEEWTHLQSSLYIMTGHLAVDSFFFTSGFMFAFSYFKEKLSSKTFLAQVRAVPSSILHRYFRITPVVSMTFLSFVYLLKYISNGPVFSYQLNILTKPCKKYWWTVFLYFQNYYVYNSGEELCITPFWYLCADMQLFLSALFLIIPIAVLYRRSFKNAIAALMGLNIFFIAVPIFTKLTWRDYDPDFQEYDVQSRLTDYFIGVMMGLYMRHQKDNKTRINTPTNIILWIITLWTMFGILVVTQEINLNHGYLAKTLCLSFTRPIWCLGLCWITFSCITRRGGIINWILSNSFMQIGGNLAYCIFLIHGPVITNYAITIKDRKQGSDWMMFYAWCGHLILSTLIATFWTLAFEMPMITLGQAIFGKGTVKASKVQKKKEMNIEFKRTG